MAKLLFDYGAYGTQISTLKNYRGKSGWLSVSLVPVEALGNLEERLVVAAVTVDGCRWPKTTPRNSCAYAAMRGSG
jgi:acyl dehydratase